MSSQQKYKNLSIPVISDRVLRTKAVAIYKQLKIDGCEHREIVSLSSHLLGLVTKGIEDKNSLDH